MIPPELERAGELWYRYRNDPLVRNLVTALVNERMRAKSAITEEQAREEVGRIFDQWRDSGTIA